MCSKRPGAEFELYLLKAPQRRLKLCEATSAQGQRKTVPMEETQKTLRLGCSAEESWQLNC